MINHSPSLGEEVYNALLSDLISLKIPPDARISVDALVRDLGVSQTPIRAALIRLEAEGLVVRRHNSGYSAAPMPTRRKFEEIYEVRLLLEPHAASQVARSTNEDDNGELVALTRAMQGLQITDAQTGYGQFALLDSQFHEHIARIAGNEIVFNAIKGLYTHMHLFRLRYHSTVASEAVQEHMEIVKAVWQGDHKAAHDAMHAHITASKKRLEPFFSKLR